MTKSQFKVSLNKELFANDINRQVDKVTEFGTNTVLIFKDAIDMKTLMYLNNRFQNGIHICDKYPLHVFINTPLQDKVII